MSAVFSRSYEPRPARAAFAPPVALPIHREAEAGRAAAVPAGKCACGGGCPRCAGQDVSGVREALQGEGRPLDADTLTTMESSFGADFGGVRVHADEGAARSAAAVG